MFKKLLFLILFIYISLSYQLKAQSSFAPLNQDYYHLIDRFEIKRGKFSEGFHTTVKPYTRKGIISLVDSVWEDNSIYLSPQDKFNLGYLQNDSWEWANPDTIGNSRKPIWNTFYFKKADAYSSSNSDFDIHINPVIDFEVGTVDGKNQKTTSLNTRGVEIRGMINRKVSFYTFLSDNISVIPDYVKEFADKYNQNDQRTAGRLPGMPGEGLTKELRQDPYSTDFFSARAYITFQATKNIQVQFGHDKNIIGNGFRSMILSDNAAPYLFLKLNTHIGRFQYQNLFTQLVYTGFKPNDQIFPRKYMTMHHLSINLSNKLNIGLTESVIFQRDSTTGSGFDLNYLNPVIFYRFIESFQGSADNAFIGIDFKWNFAKRFSLYGQFMLDEFNSKEIFKANGFWANKFGIQGGLKYINVFGIDNLDYQVELNIARPYTYSHYDDANYTHYNQNLAHPLGANFEEWTHIIRWQPLKKLQLTGRIIYANYGEDRTTTENWGQDILKSYDTRSRKILYNDFYGNFIGQGRSTVTTILDFRAAFQIKHNLFIEAHYLNRKYDSAVDKLDYTNTVSSFGVRWNVPSRQMFF
ncbi:MAG: hypothetical protein V4585_09180 [Bacteroidota bacterium]